jgi:hypothetical protein
MKVFVQPAITASSVEQSNFRSMIKALNLAQNEPDLVIRLDYQGILEVEVFPIL